MEAFEHPTVKRAKKAIRKRSLFTNRPEMLSRLPTFQRLVHCAKEAGAVEEGMLYIAAYAFLLRVPSEALPITICMGSTDVQASAAMYFANGSVYLALATRKIVSQAICCGVRVGALIAD